MEITVELMNELDAFLQGKHTPKGFRLKNLPNLNPDQAFTVIYVLQEFLHIIPDKFERCCQCGIIYDENNEGIYSGDNEEEMKDYIDAGYNFDKDDLQKHFCGGCV